MPKKRADHLREVVNNAQPASPPPNTTDAGKGRAPHGSPPALPPDCPVVPLGMDGNVRFYLDQQRQLIALPVGKHNRLELMGLYGQAAYLMEKDFPRFGKEGQVNGIDAAKAQETFLSHTAGRLWSPTRKARGRGCWLGDDGSLIVSTGTAIWFNGAWERPGLLGEHAMIAREGIMPPALLAEPGGPHGAAAEILALLQTWNWRRPIDARLMLGWIVSGFFGAALPIRPVGWLIGPKATGKSTLQTAINELLGGWVLSVLDPSPASIWQTLRYDCLAIGVDEAEPDDDKDNRRRLQELVKLARLCYSGGKLTRGGSDGEATEYALRSSVLFSSIRPPPLLPQDQSRIILMRLAKLPKHQREPDLSPRRLKALGPRLLRRAIDGWPRLTAAIEQYSLALKAVGHEGRSVAVFATALAAADIVLSDHPVDTDSAAELAAQLDFASLPEADDMPDERRWLLWVLSSVIPREGTGPRETVAAWLRQAVKSTNLFDRQDADRILAQYGLKVIRPKHDDPIHFAIANYGAGVERLHQDTHWAGRSGASGGWKEAARDLEGAEDTEQRFGDWRGRGIAIPLALAFPDGYADLGPARSSEQSSLGIEP